MLNNLPLPNIPLSVPRLPFVPDPFRRADVNEPISDVTTIGKEAKPEKGGMTPEGVAKIWGAVESLYRSGVHPAIQLCLRREGEVVINRSIGHASGNGPGEPDDAELIPADTETPFVIYSASKAMTAMLIHLLDERGELHVGDRVSEYIPGYEANGKHSVTIAHILSHRAGVPNLPAEAFDLDRINDRDFILDLLIKAEPTSRPGKALAYHAVSGGFVLGEIIHRVTGKPIDELMRTEFCEPMGMRWNNFGCAPEDHDKVAKGYATGAPPIPPISTVLTRALGVHPDRVTEQSNDPKFCSGPIPAGNIVTNAQEMSLFFEMMRRGGKIKNRRILKEATIRRALAEQSYLEIDFTLGFPTRYSLGLMLGAKYLSLYGPDTELAFGHLGFTNIIGWADPERAISGALITSGKPILYPELPLFWNTMRTIGAEAPKLPRKDLVFSP